MKVLFVCTDYYPFEGACTALLSNLFHKGRLAEKLAQIDVLSIKKRMDESDNENINGIQVHRALIWSSLAMSEVKHAIYRQPLNGLKGLFQKFYTKELEKRIHPDGIEQAEYRKTLIAELRKLPLEKYDVLVAVMGRFEVASAVGEISHKEKIPSVLYQVDPCAENFAYSFVSKEKLEHYEEEIFQKYSQIITTPIIYESQKKRRSLDDMKKFRVMEFPNIVPEQFCQRKNCSKEITCVFSGSIYGRVRDPKYTLDLFEEIAKSAPQVVLHLVGVNAWDLPDEYRAINVKCYGRLPMIQAHYEMRNADFLVNIGNTVKNQVPSKLFEYISTGKPIINICKNRDCPTLPYLRRYPYSLNIIEGEQDLSLCAKRVLDFIDKNFGSQCTSEYICKEFWDCTPEYCGEVMRQTLYAAK